MTYDLNENTNLEDFLEFLIDGDDILVKFLNYIEFWQEKNISLKNRISILNLFSHFLKIPLSNELINIQVL